MKKGQIYQGIVEKIEFPNKGIVMIDGQRVIVKNGVCGQKVEFSISKVRKKKAEGRLLNVLEQSPLEIKENVCRHFGVCGGCLYQSIPYSTQLEIKKEQVKELLDSVCDDYEFEGIIGSPISDGYRNKMEFSFGDEVKGGDLALGMHKRGSFYDIVTVADCRIADEDFIKILMFTLEYFRERNVGFYKKMLHTGVLRHLLIRKAVKTGDILVDLVTTTQEKLELYDYVKGLLEIDLKGKIKGILNTLNDGVADVVKSDKTVVLYGQDFICEEILGLRFKITPFSFFQTNSLGAEVLYEKAREYIGETRDKIVFDLYSGTGTIAQMAANISKKVVGVEIVEEAVEAARENARLNELDNCEFIAGDVLKVIDEIEEKPDIIILDPPRDGIHPKAIGKIIDYGVDRIVYISCKPTSLVRDLEIMQARGYKVDRACAVDMFPQTANVETIVLLSQQKPDDTIEIDLDLNGLDATSAKLKATYQEIKDYVLKELVYI